ncbi:hypothetical protein BJV82DRAFT_672544 [Fennellomyces sp. T-0311]|nr:hypothetical protein BJV82DRAFT_672544 [Fennellomyces sp. T-0311]
MSVEQDEFWRICDDSGKCHCDWRLTVTGCEEESAFKAMYIVNGIASGILAVAASAILFQRIYFHKQTIFDLRSIIRPKPIESMAALGIVFHFLRMIHTIIVVLDAAPNVAFRSFLFELPWEFAFAALACYLFGMAHTLSDVSEEWSSKIIYDTWVGSPYIIDGAYVCVVTLPFISNNVCSIAAGVLGLQGNFFLADRFTSVLYYFWTFYTCSLGVFIVYAGFRLIGLLQDHFEGKPGVSAEDIEKLKLGAVKVKIVTFSAFGSLLLFSLINVLYGVFRHSITTHMPYNMTIAVIWTFNGILATALIVFSVILNPRMASFAGLASIPTGDNGDMSNSRMSKWLVLKSSTTPRPSSDFERHTKQQTSESKPVDLESGFHTIAQPASKSQSCRESDQSHIEEDQRRYNTMTHFIRVSPRNVASTDEHR